MLPPKRLEFGLGLLAVTNPICSSRLELFVGLLQLAALLAELGADLFLERWRGLDLSAALAQPSEVRGEGTGTLEERAAPSLLGIQPIHLVQRGHNLA